MHVLIDSLYVQLGVSARYRQEFKPAHTANMDLLDACADLLRKRDAAGFSFSWTKVKSHEEDTPPEHELADELAGEAAELPLPHDHLQRINPAFALLSKSGSGVFEILDDGDLKRRVHDLRYEDDAEGLPPHLRFLKSEDVNHTLSGDVTAGHYLD